MARRVSARSIKAHRQYTYEEAARALGVSAQTVRSWRKHGLVVIDDQKPHLIPMLLHTGCSHCRVDIGLDPIEPSTKFDGFRQSAMFNVAINRAAAPASQL